MIGPVTAVEPGMANTAPRTTSQAEATAPETPQLTMYSTVWCGYCRRLKLQLDQAGIAFAEVDIERDPAAAEYVASVNGGNQTVPTVTFADGTALTNPPFTAVVEKLADLAA